MLEKLSQIEHSTKDLENSLQFAHANRSHKREVANGIWPVEDDTCFTLFSTAVGFTDYLVRKNCSVWISK